MDDFEKKTILCVQIAELQKKYGVLPDNLALHEKLKETSHYGKKRKGECRKPSG